MATIYSRHNKNGSTTWAVLIRRKNIPTFSKYFLEEKEAKEWVLKNEEDFIKNPLPYIQENNERLNEKREREFKRKKLAC